MRLPRPERRQHWSGEGSAARADGSAHRPPHAHSKATQAASLPAGEGCGQTQAGNAETQLGDWTKTTPLVAISQEEVTLGTTAGSLLPLQPGTTGAADRGSPKVCPQLKGKEATGKLLPYKNIGLVNN